MHTSSLFKISSLFAGLISAQTPSGFVPSANSHLEVSYSSRILTPGLHLPLNATTTGPVVRPPSNNSLVLMLDLDTPYGAQNRSLAPFLHWITTTSPSRTNESVISYASPSPPPGSPDHRYVLLSYSLPGNHTGVFNMPQGFEDVGTTLMSKAKFDLEGVVARAHLTGPTAANWFTVRQADTEGETEEFKGAASPSMVENRAWFAVRMVILGASVTSL